MSQKVKKILNRLNRRDIPLFSKKSKIFKPLLYLFLIVFVVFISKSVLALSNTPSEVIDGFKAKQNAMEEGNNQESWMKESASSNAMVGINILAGTIPDEVLNGEPTAWIPGGLIGLTTQSIAIAYNLPISGVEYIAHVKNNFLGKDAYAATGFERMSPLIPLWKGFRDATYLIFSLVFVIMGLMIMLRVKISPQATLTIQSAIPKIITALILVTFSYAIVGLLIDLTYVITGLGLSIVMKASGDTSSVMEIIKDPNLTLKVLDISNPIWITGLIAAFAAIPLGILASSGIGAAPAAAIGVVTVVIVFLVSLLIIFINIVKFLIGLIKCYITILLKTIIAPLEIALGAIPNMKIGFNTWLLSIFANLMVFPISLIFLVLVRKIMDAIKSSGDIWTPSVLNVLDGGGMVATMVGIGGLFLLSKLPKLIPEFIFQIKPSPFGDAIGENMKPFSNTAKGTAMYGVSAAGARIQKNYGGKNNTTSEKAANIFGKATNYFAGKRK